MSSVCSIPLHSLALCSQLYLYPGDSTYSFFSFLKLSPVFWTTVNVMYCCGRSTDGQLGLGGIEENTISLPRCGGEGVVCVSCVYGGGGGVCVCVWGGWCTEKCVVSLPRFVGAVQVGVLFILQREHSRPVSLRVTVAFL